MKRITTVIIGALILIAISMIVLIALPYRELRDERAPDALSPYTLAQLRGRATYVALGCATCHSQQPRPASVGPDALRGWGRASTPADYAYDAPHLLGTSRTGPDLFNIGARQPSVDWQLAHLYQPRAVTPGSVMPAFPYLFRIVDAPAPDERAVPLPPAFAPARGTVVATREARDLVDYLLALNHTYPIESRTEEDATQ
jgi:cytochrome c oxidase cbb3-type subunit II